MRNPEEFMRARKVVIKRMVKAGDVPQDVELFMEFTVIIQALEIAAAVSAERIRTLAASGGKERA